MATQLQKKLAKAIIKDAKNPRPKTGGELLESVGYAKNTAEAVTGRTLEAKGVKEALSEYGFSLDEADKVVGEILHKGKEENRLKASDQIYKRLGGYQAEKHINLNLEAQVSPEIKELADKLDELYRGQEGD